MSIDDLCTLQFKSKTITITKLRLYLYVLSLSSAKKTHKSSKIDCNYVLFGAKIIRPCTLGYEAKMKQTESTFASSLHLILERG